MKDKSYTLEFLRPAERWDHAVPLGNGRMGALFSGNAGDERMPLNAEDFFAGAERRALPDLSDKLQEVRALLRAGRPDLAERVYPDAFLARGGGGSAGKFLPVADFFLRTDVLAPFSDYARALDMATGEAYARWKEGEAEMEKRCFISREGDELYVSVCSSREVTAEASICPRDRADDFNIFCDKLNTPVRVRSEFRSGALVARVDAAGEKRSFVVRASRPLAYAEGDAQANAIGVPQTPFECPYVRARGRDILFRVTLCAGEEDERAALAKPLGDYGQALARTAEYNAALMLRSDFSFGEEDDRAVDLLLLDAGRGNPPLALLEKAAKFGKYMLAMSGAGGKCPPHLQGLWNGSNDPAWFSVYFMNENLPMCLWQACAGGMTESMLPVFDLAESLTEDFRENAAKLFGCRGIYVPVYFSPRSGLQTDCQPHVLYWTAGAAWLAGMYYDYYRFTGDEVFLRERALPFMREAAAFYEDFLTVGEDGYYHSSPSVSPENCARGDFPRAGEIFVSENATMDIAAEKELFLALARHGEEKYAALAKKFPPYRIGEEGELREWLSDRYRENHRHRHLSHIYPFFPGGELSADGAFAEAVRRSVRLRETVGLDAQTGWSFAHLANIYARLGEGDRAFGALENLARYCTLPGLFTTHNDWRNMGATLKLLWAGKPPFQADANMGSTAAVYECFVRSTEEEIRLLPALPSRMKRGSARGILTRAKAKTSVFFEGEKGRAEIEAYADTAFTLVLPSGERRRTALSKGEKTEIEFALKGEKER